MRIDRFLANLKYGSRSEIHLVMKSGRVTVNGVVETNQRRLIQPESDTVTFDEKIVFYRDPVVLMVHKPGMTVSSNVDDTYPSILRLIQEPFSRFDLSIAGRLDADAEGLLILTNAGELVHRIITPKMDIEKTYLVHTARDIVRWDELTSGITILDGENHPFLTKPAKIKLLNARAAEIRITEGKFHQVKRMFEAIGNEVVYLKRTAIGNLQLDVTLPMGSYRLLEPFEIAKIFANE
jgi:16S rRNA pseudouridine516 synthase